MKRKQQGFTLLEILVVVGILSIIAAILFPVFSRVRARARKTTCTSNLKQIGMAFQQYTQDYDGRLPASEAGLYVTAEGHVVKGVPEYAFSRLMQYIKNTQIFRCPEDTRPNGAVMIDSNAYARISYVPIGKNESVGDDSPARWGLFDGPRIATTGTHLGVTMSEIVAPAETISVTEDVNTSPTHGALAHIERGDATPGGGTSGFTGHIGAAHSGGANYLFADSHVKWFIRGAENEEYNGGRTGAHATINDVNYYYFWRRGVKGKM